IGEISGRRGQVMGMDTSKSGESTIRAQVPELEMDDFHTFLAKLTLEKGHYTYSYDHDEPMPKNVAERQKANNVYSASPSPARHEAPEKSIL
ncbi:MAG: hypothetical protein RSA20_07375, partial [Oscillospiraceae bacterium]